MPSTKHILQIPSCKQFLLAKRRLETSNLDTVLPIHLRKSNSFPAALVFICKIHLANFRDLGC